MPKYPDPATWEHAAPQQAARAARSFAALRVRAVPAYQGPLFGADDDEVRPPSAAEVARRALVLWAVILRAEGMPHAEVAELVGSLGVASSVSPAERAFLDDEDPDPDLSIALVWRLEALWVLLWALRLLDDLPWPAAMCDVPTLAGVMQALEEDPATAVALRPVAEILDAQDLTMRLHWAIRDAYLHQGGLIPERLDWSESDDLVPCSHAAAVGIVEQRHHALNWLTQFLGPVDWDHVDTPT